MNLWKELDDWKKNCEWVELTHELSPETPHWDGFPAMEMSPIYEFPSDGFLAFKHIVAGQYGTHVDAPCHFNEGKQTLDWFTPDRMVNPLCVIDKSAACAENEDYALTIKDVEDWEAKNGKIPEGAFVAFRSDWYKKGNSEAMDNKDSAGQKHYPGWLVETIKWLVEKRNIASIGHETSDTDPAVLAEKNSYAAETYILSVDRFQIEMLRNLDKVPATGALIITAFPKLKNGAGFPARCFAVCPK